MVYINNKNQKNMIFKAKGLFLTLAIIVSLSSFAFAQEQMAVTTYYPSPAGVYNQLRLAPYPASSCPGGCASCAEPGLIFYAADTHEIMYCDGASNTWQQLGAGTSYWDIISNGVPGPDYLVTHDTIEATAFPFYRVGIGTTTPELKLTLDGDGGIMAKGTYGSGAQITTTGEANDASRFIWYPRKSAFWAGYTSGDYWDDINIGEYSIALGFIPRASGDHSIAVNAGTASGDYSISLGLTTSASADHAVVVGGRAVSASGPRSIVVGGNQITASGNNAAIMGIGPGGSMDNTIDNSLMINYDIGGWPLLPSFFIQGNGASGYVVVRGTDPQGYDFYVYGLAQGNLDWNDLSDERLKKNIHTIDNALDKVMKLRGVNFQWKDPKTYSQGTKMGIIAQEAKDIIPEVVNKNSKYYSTEYGPIVALLIEAIKQQEEELDKIEEEIEQDKIK